MVAAAVAAFGLSLEGSFHFDDYALFNSPEVISLGATRPLTNLTFQINRWMGGTNPAGYHLVNLLLHVAAAVLLERALRRVISARAALLAALVFAVHPIQTEPVNYVFARGTLLSTLFCIVALDAWLREKPWAAVAWFAAALLSKEESVTFPLFLWLFDFVAGRMKPARQKAVAAMLALSLAAGIRVLGATAAIPGTATGYSAHTGPFEYLSCQGLAMLRYAKLLVIPWGFTIDADLGAPALWLRIGAWLGVAALLAAASRFARNAAPGFWFIGAFLLLLPSSSIFAADDYAADRRMYLPMVAVAAGVGLLAERVDWRIAAALLVAWCAISVRYCSVWETERGLWTEAVKQAPLKARPRLWLSRTASSAGEAAAILAEAQRIAPEDAALASEQGRVLLEAGRPAEALAAYGRALALTPGDAGALSNRGAALAMLGQTEAAQQDFEAALKKDPCQFNARVNLKRLGNAPQPLPPQCRFTPEQQAELGR